MPVNSLADTLGTLVASAVNLAQDSPKNPMRAASGFLLMEVVNVLSVVGAQLCPELYPEHGECDVDGEGDLCGPDGSECGSWCELCLLSQTGQCRVPHAMMPKRCALFSQRPESEAAVREWAQGLSERLPQEQPGDAALPEQ